MPDGIPYALQEIRRYMSVDIYHTCTKDKSLKIYNHLMLMFEALEAQLEREQKEAEEPKPH